MPANVTPDYQRAEQRFRHATTDAERLEALQEMLRTLPKHKGTEKMQADLKRRISALRKAESRGGAGGRGPDPYHVPKSGAGQVVLVGAPNVGKSALVGRLTHAQVKVADYPFATPLPVPGMAYHEDAPIELVDTPPVAEGHLPGELVGTIRAADAIAVVADLAGDPLAEAELVLGLLGQRGVVLRSVPRAASGADAPGIYPGLIVATKADLGSSEDLAALRELYAGRLDVLRVSAETGEGLQALLARLWDLLAMIRVYTRQPGREADLGRPFTLPAGSTVEDLARAIHRELPEKMTFARLWGHGRFEGMQVQRTEPLADRDVVEIHE
jgi:ribosome-interacting GTPase 1